MNQSKAVCLQSIQHVAFVCGIRRCTCCAQLRAASDKLKLRQERMSAVTIPLQMFYKYQKCPWGINSLLAQVAERLTTNQEVVGSSPM